MILVLIPIFPTISYADLPDDFCNDLRQKYSNEISDHIQCHDTGKISENKLYPFPFITPCNFKILELTIFAILFYELMQVELYVQGSSRVIQEAKMCQKWQKMLLGHARMKHTNAAQIHCINIQDTQWETKLQFMHGRIGPILPFRSSIGIGVTRSAGLER